MQEASIIYNPTNGRFFTNMVVLDSAARDTVLYPTLHDYCLTALPETTNVCAVRLIKAELYDMDSSIGDVVIDGAHFAISPLSSFFANKSLHIYLNGYNAITVAGHTEIPFFGRLSAPVESFSAVSADIEKEPYSFMLIPAVQALQDFHVKLYTSDGEPYVGTPSQRMVLTVALHYMK